MVLIEWLVMQLFLWVLAMIDGLVSIFSAISGLTNVSYNSEKVDMLQTFLGNSTVTTIFWCIFLLTVGLGCLFATCSIIKNIITNKSTVKSIVGKFFLFLLGTLAVLAVLYFGILISNAVLQLLGQIFGMNKTSTISNALFDACASGTYKDGWTIDAILARHNADSITEIPAVLLLGDYHDGILGSILGSVWKLNGYVDAGAFQYLLAAIGSVIILIELIIVTLHLAKRLYEIVFLYFIMPASMSTLPIDDGARFKNWREQFVTKIIIIYGAVIAVNLFTLLASIFSRMEIEGFGSFGNSLFRVFMLVGGAMMMKSGIELFAKVLGHGEDLHQSDHVVHTVATWGFRGLLLAGRLGHKAVSYVQQKYQSTHGSNVSAKTSGAYGSYGMPSEPGMSGKDGRDGKDGEKGEQGSPGKDGKDTPQGNGGNKTS